jgi:acetolactate decarboxylase
MKITCCFLLLLIAHTSFAQSQVHHTGSMSTMGKENFKATVLLDTLSKSHLYGIGPYGKMQGEITVLDGIPFISQADEQGSGIVTQNWNSEAPFFVYAHVDQWISYPIKKSIKSVRDLQQVIEELATKNGYDSSTPFPFRIKGTITELTTHIVTPRSPDVPGYKQGRNQENYTNKNMKGELLGFYSQHHQRIYTHHDSFIHIHFIDAKRKVMGHVDKMAVEHKKLIILFPSK